MRALKFVVIVMGLAIVIGMTVLVTVIAERAGLLAGGGAGADGTALPNAPVESPVTAAIKLPPGARVVESRLDGGRILLRLALAGGAGRVLVVDAATARVVGTYDLVPGEEAEGAP